jgi:hypothetical protein
VLYKIESKRGIEIDNLFGFKNLKNQPWGNLKTTLQADSASKRRNSLKSTEYERWKRLRKKKNLDLDSENTWLSLKSFLSLLFKHYFHQKNKPRNHNLKDRWLTERDSAKRGITERGGRLKLKNQQSQRAH